MIPGIFCQQPLEGLLFFLPRDLTGGAENDGTLILGAKLCRQQAGLADDTERNLWIVDYVVNFAAFSSAMKIDVVVDDAEIEGYSVGESVSRYS